jgi:DNA replication protein DnaC
VEDCPVCKDLGWLRQDLPVGHPQFGIWVHCGACGRMNMHLVALYDATSSRPGRASRQYFHNFCLDGDAASARAAYNAAVAFAAEPRGWLVIHGPKGNGKSHLAAAITNHLIERCNVPTLFATAPEFLNTLRREIEDAVQKGVHPSSTLMDVARRVPVLILDDLGAERRTPWAMEQIYLLLDHRYRHESATVVITNEELESLPARIYSRLGDRALCKVVHNPANDYRWGHGRITP